MSRTYKRSSIKGLRYLNLGSPIYAQMELTSRCNYDCSFCYNIWKVNSLTNLPELSREQALSIAKELINLHIFSVILSGGEPTLVPYLMELIDIFAENEIDVTMITNGSKITNQFAKDLKTAGLQHIQISMHHYSKDVFNRLTSNRYSYELTSQGIKNAIEVFSNNLNVNMVVLPETVQDISTMALFLMQLGVESMSVSLASTSGQALKNNISCTRRDLLRTYEEAKKVSKEIQISFVGGLPFCGLPKDYDPSIISMANICDAALTQVVIGPNGGIRPCVEWPVEAGNIFNDSLKEIWQHSPVFKNIRKFKNVPNECIDCEEVAYCHGGCRASALAMTGDVRGKDPLMNEGGT